MLTPAATALYILQPLSILSALNLFHNTTSHNYNKTATCVHPTTISQPPKQLAFSAVLSSQVPSHPLTFSIHTHLTSNRNPPLPHALHNPNHHPPTPTIPLLPNIHPSNALRSTPSSNPPMALHLQKHPTTSLPTSHNHIHRLHLPSLVSSERPHRARKMVSPRLCSDGVYVCVE